MVDQSKMNSLIGGGVEEKVSMQAGPQPSTHDRLAHMEGCKMMEVLRLARGVLLTDILDHIARLQRQDAMKHTYKCQRSQNSKILIMEQNYL